VRAGKISLEHVDIIHYDTHELYYHTFAKTSFNPFLRLPNHPPVAALQQLESHSL